MASLLSLRQSFDPPKPPRRLPVWVPASVAGVVVLVAVVLAVAIPRALRSPDVLAAVPVALAKPGANGLAGAPDPGASPSPFAAFVPARLDAYWRRAFASMGRSYRPPTLDLFGYATSLPCFPLLDFNDGPPYYCFLNDTIYLPLQYVSDLAGATGTLGPVAVAYVLAHEYAHHVQYLTGLGATVEYGEAKPGAVAQQASIDYELQADCLAGVWISTVVPPGELSQPAMAAAQDTAMLIHGGEGVASADTHGTLPQRQSAFWTGFTTGRASRCTFR